MAVRIFALQPVQPIDAKARAFIAVLGGPERDIVLLGQIFAAAIVAVVIDDQEMIDPQVPVIFQEKWQANPFVSQGGENEQI